MTENICYFVPYHKDDQSIHTVNFVWENKPQLNTSLKSESVYKIHYVCGGSGFLHTFGNVQPLAEGDIFFTFPGTPFCIRSEDSFSYMYISFLGARANRIMEKLRISASHFYFPACTEVYAFWKNAFDTRRDLTDILSESVLLYTFAYIGNKMSEPEEKGQRTEETFLKVKKYIDDHFTDADLSLAVISAELRYHPKYLSGLFKKKMGIGTVQYLNTIRIQNACTLIEQGLTSVNEIATLSGYKDALYFSKCFKIKMGMSPRSYMAVHAKESQSLSNRCKE
ncbi:MAG: AraC family transcriptional regulator [Eubacteriales bacterium]